MSQHSSFQRFLGELRRRHVPQTAAIYLVAAWAAIEFANVVVPNLNGPQWVLTAVIVAAGVGLPVVLMMAWIFDWGPSGLQRTSGDATPNPETASSARSSGAQWMPAVAVLVVAIGSGVAVAALLEGKAGRPSGEPTGPPELVPPGGVVDAESIRRRVMRDLEQIEGLGDLGRLGDLEALGDGADGDGMGLGDVVREAARHADLKVLLQEPDEWTVGRADPVELAEGDTLTVRGMARDSRGVLSVSLDGEIVAEVEQPRRNLSFAGHVVGDGRSGTRQVVILVTTADGGEIRREYPVGRLPGGSAITDGGGRR